VSDCASDGHCITCSDEGMPMRVVELTEAGVARCTTDDGATSEVMCDLVGAVSPGDAVLVHAGVALLRLA
jgi:hydrogenase expression/formation protein HypC